MDTVKAIIQKAQTLPESIAADVFPDGAILTCRDCGHVREITAADCGQYFRTAWPTHCGRTMLLDLKGDGMDKLVEGASGMLYPEGDELFPVVRMPPRKSTQVVIVTPERLAELGGEVKRLRTACESALFTIEALESGNLTDWAAHYTMVASACATLRAVLKKKGDGDE